MPSVVKLWPPIRQLTGPVFPPSAARALTVSRDPASISKLPSSAFSGMAVTTLTTPPIAWLPHRVDWGPRSTSIREASPTSRFAKL